MYVKKIFFLAFCVLLVSCSKQTTTKSAMVEMRNEKYGFSFKHPSNWNEVTKDLPEKWAIVDNQKNTMLFTVGQTTQTNLTILGRYYALKDLYEDSQVIRLSTEDLDKIYKIVKIENFNGKEWYTYGIKFSEKNVDSLISGTLCNSTEITMVLISNPEKYESYKLVYEDMLASFSC